MLLNIIFVAVLLTFLHTPPSGFMYFILNVSVLNGIILVYFMEPFELFMFTHLQGCIKL